MCRREEMQGAIKDGGRWLIPKDAVARAVHVIAVPRGQPRWWATAERARANGARSVRPSS